MNDNMELAAEVIRARSGLDGFDIGIILGTGLAEAMEPMQNETVIPFADLPGFPALGVSGHSGVLAAGVVDGKNILCLKGRAHYYERGNSRAMLTPIETMAMLGVSTLVITSTVGSVNADFFPGGLVIIEDHINLSGTNPLIGSEGEAAFISMTHAYDEKLAARLKRAAVVSGVTVKDGTYMWFSGPSFETPAEVRMARQLGADVIGMSVVPETLLARRAGLRVCAVSAVTNFGAGFHNSDPSHIETRTIARNSAISLRRLLRAFLKSSDAAMPTGDGRPSLRRQT